MKQFYHNITKKQYNETDAVDLMDNYSDGDFLLKTEAGNALVSEVT